MKSLIKKIITRILVLEARLILAKYKPQIIAITGNVGKTSTKDAIGHVLMEHLHVRKSNKSYNSDFGVPLTVIGSDTGWGSAFAWLSIIFRGLSQIIFTEDYPKVLVLEVGADTPGDIQSISKWLHPDITVITQFQPVPVHVEFFKDREHLVREKGYLVEATKKEGLVLYTSDDHDSHELSKLSSAKSVSYGFENWSEVRAESLDTLYEITGDFEAPIGIAARISVGDSSIPMKLTGILGGGHIYSALPALYIGTLFGVNLLQGAQALEIAPKPRGRMRLLRGIKRTTIIDDTYNASPKAVEHALKTLAGLHTDGKKIAVLGDMMELGKKSQEEHIRIGKVAAQSVHILVTVGKRSRDIAEGAMGDGMSEENIYQADSSLEAGRYVEGVLAQNDVILVKGSQSIRTEKVVEEIMSEVDIKSDLLVRQEKEWQAR